MVDTPRKTFPELTALSAPVVDSDVLAVYRSPGPAKRTTASVLKTYAQTGLGTMATQNADAVAITGGVISGLTNCTSTEFTTTIPVAGASVYTKNIVTMPAPTSGMTNDAGGNDAVNTKWYVNASKQNNGPVGQVNYWNTVTALCVNSDASFVPLNTAMPAGSFRIESKFYQAGVFGTEFHISQGQTGGGGEFRTLTAFVPHLTTDWAEASSQDLRSSTQVFADGAGTTRVQLNIKPSAGAGNLTFNGVGTENIKLRFDKNNSAFMRQRNAANSADIDLPYLDDRNVLRLIGASFQQGAAPTAGVNTGTGYFAEDQNTTPRAGGGHRFVLTGSSVTGNYYGYNHDSLSVSGNYWFTNVRNSHATGKLIDKRVAEGDIIYSALNDGGTNQVNFGRRASDGAFVVACGATDAFTNPAIEVANATRYVNLPAGQLSISGTKVLGTQGAAVADATDAASVIARLNDLLARCRAHGLIAT